MLSTNWRKHQIPEIEGIVCASGDILTAHGSRMLRSSHVREQAAWRWLDVDVLLRKVLQDGEHRLECGEASAHGSIGFIVLSSVRTGEPLWSFFCEWANPFDQIEVKGGHVLVLSTSGAILRFTAPLHGPSWFAS